ncbi:MAG: PspC domain-containing protein [Candidatus Azobacteroides sp.]|nr:PspC domain-containing protein [Candidatus Azobacteroides sp.]
MKPTVKVSIGGRAFNLEEDAYLLLDNYLKSLQAYFDGNPESGEIIEDIEFRMSELLQMRLKNAEGVISLSDATAIVEILGNPKDFDNPDEAEKKQGPEYATKKANNIHWVFKKRLYRDMADRIFGGVCSGLGHYFRIDPVLFRLVFLGSFLLGIFGNYSFFFSRLTGVVTLIYFILWIIIPKAVTFNQKLEMTGPDPSIEHIRSRTDYSSRPYRGSSITRILKIMVKVFAGIIIVSLLLSLLGIIFSFTWLNFDSDILGINNYLILLGLNGWNFKIPLFLLLGLPFVGMVALLLKLLRPTPFTNRGIIIFIIGFILWCGSIFYLVGKSAKTAYFFQEEAQVFEEIKVRTQHDTLYVRLDESFMNAEQQPNNESFFYQGKKEKEKKLFILPKIKMEEDTLLTDYLVEIRKTSFGNKRKNGMKQVNNSRLDYNLQDSMMVIHPPVFSRKNRWDRSFYEIKIKVPKGKSIEISAPLKENYSVSFNKKYFYWD